MQEGMDVKHQLIPEKIRLAIKVSLTETGGGTAESHYLTAREGESMAPLVRVKLYNSIHPSNYRNTRTPTGVPN